MKTDKENELKMIGTCGHRISEGIASWVKKDGQLVYGTFCGNCVYFFHKQGRLVNKEISDLMLNSEYSLNAELEIATNAGLEAQERVKEYDTILNDNYFILNQNKKLKAELEKANSEINARVSDVEFWKKNAEYFDECCREKDPVITDLDVELEKARELIEEILGIENKNKPVIEALKDVRCWEEKAKEFLKKEGE